MRNLKRALSLILAAAMLIGMMVVGAGAVSYNDFPDRDEIVNKDAVSMLTTLGIIEGTDQGTYNPTGNVDRAQMAKMISVALTNNEDCDTLYQNVDSGLTDIAANWARGYINYCYTLGIIAGRGNNTFDPSANVTGVEAAKMLLAALGYDAEVEGLVGTDWALNTAALAQNLGIFRNFTKDVSAPLNRDDAALLIYNALDVELIQEYRNGYAISYDDHRTILSSVFGVIRVEGVVIGNEWAQLEETDSDAALQAGRTRLEDVVWYDSTTANTVVDEGVVVTDPVTFNVATPVDYIGKAVTLYVEKTTILSNSVVIGVATNDDMNTVVTSAANQAADDDLLDGTGVAVNDSTQYYVNYGHYTRARALDLINDYDWDEDAGRFNNNGVEVEVIDNDDDGTAEYVLYTRETLSNVVRTSSRDETTTINVPIVNNSGMLSYTGSRSNPSYTTTQVIDNEDIVTELELAADDLILYVQYGGRTYITAPEIVTDTMTRVDRDRNNEQYITLSSGETYRMSYIREVLSMVDADVTRFEFENLDTTAGFDTSYEWILDSNGYIVDFRPAEETVKNYGLVLDSAWTQNALSRSGEIKILDTTAIEHTYSINWNASRDVFDYDGKQSNSVLDSALEDYLGTRDVNDPGNANVYDLGSAKGTVIEYTLNEAGDTLTITNVLDLNTLGSDNGLDDSTAADKDDITVDVSTGLGSIAYMEDNYLNNVLLNAENLQYTTTRDYTTRDGNLYVSYEYPAGTTVNKTFAVDLNTVAFYYDVVEAADLQVNGRYYGSNYSVGDVLYGVATGWDEMGDVADGTKVQVYPVITKQGGNYTASNLADVVLFNYELTTDTADWMLVLNANAVNSDTLELNVVFEDGTTAAIEVDRDDYDDTFYRNSSAYMKAYKYSVNANGQYTINTNSAVGDTPASLLRDGTVDTNTGYQYLTITGDTHIWDVTDVDSAEDEVQPGSFDYANAKHAVIIPTDSNRTIKTAWVWDMDGDTVIGSNCTFDWTLTNYETVWAPTGVAGNWVDYMVWTQIRDAFAAGKNVMIFGDANLAYSIDIPAGLILQVEGDLTTSSAGNVTGNGTLRVHGTFYANTDIRVATYAEDLRTANNIGIYANIHVQEQANLGRNDANDGAITIGTGVHLCARNADNLGYAIRVVDDVDNYGHVETTGNIYYAAAFRDLSANSMIINGDMVFDTNGSLTVGSGTTYTGNVTVLGGNVTAVTGATGVSLYVDNGTVALGTGSSIDLRAGTNAVLTVDNGGRITQTYSYNTQNVMADIVTINGGDVAIYGDLVASNTLNITGANAEVSARNINAMPGGTVVIDSTVRPGNVTGTIAQGITGTTNPVTGDVTYNGNYTTTVAETENWLTEVYVGGVAANLDAETRTGAVTLTEQLAASAAVTFDRADPSSVTAVAIAVNNGAAITGNTVTNLATGDVIYLTMTVAGETQTYAISVTVAETSYTVGVASNLQNVTIQPTNAQFVSGTYYIAADTEVLFTVDPADGYAIATVTYQVDGATAPVNAQYVSTDSDGVATYRVPATAVKGNITLNATVKEIVNDAALTLKVSDDYKVDVDTTATLVAEITNQNSSNVEVLVSSLPRDLTEAGYVLEIDNRRDASEGVYSISFSGYSVNEDGTSATVTVTTTPTQGYNKVTKTVTFTVADAETKVTKDVAVIREWINGYVFDLTTTAGNNNNYAEIVKQAIVDQFDDGVWGSTVEVGNVSLDGDIQSGMMQTSVSATLNITVSSDDEASASIGTMTINVKTN